MSAPSVAAGEPAVHLEGVSYRYPGAAEDALHRVSVAVGPRDFVGIVGPNGGGKTTLLRLILGVLEPREGRITVLGAEPKSVCSRIGFVPQDDRIDPTIPADVLDIVLLGRLSRRSWGPRFQRRDLSAAREALHCTGTEDLASRSWAALSGGQRQRVLIARALASGADLLLLDEPMRGVDRYREGELLALLHRLNERLPIVLVTHDLCFVAANMDGAVWVDREALAMPAPELTLARGQTLFHPESSSRPGRRSAGGARR